MPIRLPTFLQPRTLRLPALLVLLRLRARPLRILPRTQLVLHELKPTRTRWTSSLTPDVSVVGHGTTPCSMQTICLTSYFLGGIPRALVGVYKRYFGR